MHLLTWHGTFVCLPDQTGTMRHQAFSAEGARALDIDLPSVPGGASLRHAELGNLQLEAAPEPGAVHLLRDGLYMCADNNNGLVVFDRQAAAAWESFLPLRHQDAADLDLILRYRWIERATRRVIRRNQIGMRDGFMLHIGPYSIDIAAALGDLATRRGENGLPTAITVHHAGEAVELVVAEPRSSALVQTEMWPPRARRIAEIMTFAAHRQVTGLEPTQEDFEHDVKFLQDRQGAAGLEDLLEQVVQRAGPSIIQVSPGLEIVAADIEAATGQGVAALERLTAASPDDPQLWFSLGEMQYEAGAYGAAQRAWEHCLSLEPGQHVAALRLANLAAYFGRPLESISRLGALVAATPQAHDPRVFLAQRYAELDWMDRALDAFAPIAGELSNWKEANHRGMLARVDSLQSRFDELSFRPGPLAPQDAIQQARLAFSLGRLDICGSLLDALPDAAAARAETHLLQSDLRLRRDGLNEAIAYLESLDGPERQNAGLIVALARLHIAAGWNEEAAAALSALVRRTPRGDALRLLAMIAHTTADKELLRFTTQTWSALSERDVVASQWAIAEARLDGRIARIGDVAANPDAPPYPTVVQFWDQAARPVDVIQAMQTWQNRNPGIVHSVFDDAMARAFIAAHCPADVLECYAAAHHPAMQSDIFRLAFLHVRGGIYVDADDLCTRDMRSIFAALSSAELIAVCSTESPPYVHNNFIAARPGCAVVANALRDAVHDVLITTRGGKPANIWQSTGPGLLTRAIARFTADPANAGKVILLTDSEYHAFSITQDMAYKHAETGDWRLLKATAPAAPAAVPPRSASPSQASLDDLATGWAMREVAPWQFRPVRKADADRYFGELNENHRWSSVFHIVDGRVSVKPKPAHMPQPDLLRDRTERYQAFFQLVTAFLPSGFQTTLCMGMGDGLPDAFDVPIFCFQKNSSWTALLLPDVDFLNHDFYAAPALQDRLSYQEKQPGAVFAGGTTGGLITLEVARDLSTPRLRAAKFFTGSTKVDFRLPGITQCTTPAVEAMLRALPFCQKPALDWQEQLRRRMMISMDGNGAACSRMAVALHSNSVLLKYASDNVLYYFGGLQPWVHYVPIAQDSDVERVVDMEARDPERFAKIAASGKAFAQSHLGAEAAQRYTAMLLRLYEEAFSDRAAPLRPRPSAQARGIAPLPPGDMGAMMAHIQKRGDRSFRLGEWVGERGSGLAIEGFAISLPAHYPAGFTYRAVMANGVLSVSGRSGAYRGTRGENLPAYGLLITLEDKFAETYEIACEASFIDGTHIGPVPAGTLCTSLSQRPLEAVRLMLVQRQA